MVDSEQHESKKTSWTQKQVYVMGTICVALGLMFGYLLRGSGSTAATVPAAERSAVAQPTNGGQPQAMPSLEDMKRMADKTAEPLLAELKRDPKNPVLLVKLGNAYKSTHQFTQAARYYAEALELTPKDIALRDELGAVLYYSGDVDKAIAVFEAGLKYAPNDPSMLLDLGLVKLRKKSDGKGAVELWRRMLEKNPDLPAEKRDQVKALIAQAEAPTKSQN